MTKLIMELARMGGWISERVVALSWQGGGAPRAFGCASEQQRSQLGCQRPRTHHAHPRALLAAGTCVLLVLAGCSQVTNTLTADDPVGTAKNIAICTALEQPLVTINEQIDAIAQDEGAKAAASQLAGLLDQFGQSGETATSGLDTALAGLDSSVSQLVTAMGKGASPAKLSNLSTAVKTQVRAVQAQCAIYSQ